MAVASLILCWSKYVANSVIEVSDYYVCEHECTIVGNLYIRNSVQVFFRTVFLVISIEFL